MKPESIADYIAAMDPVRGAIAERLTNNIDAALPQATGKLWHGIPVWFVGENPAVGFTARKQGVMLMFWNGQHFVEPGLEASGSFHMAQIPYLDASQMDEQKLGRWLAEAATSVWDMVGERRAFVAKRRAGKAKATTKARAKSKASARPDSKSQPNSKSRAAAARRAVAKKAATRKQRSAKAK